MKLSHGYHLFRLAIKTMIMYGFSYVDTLRWRNALAQRIGVNQTNALAWVFAPLLCHSGQTHRFRCCSVAATGAFNEAFNSNSRNGNNVKLKTIHILLTDDFDIVIQVILVTPMVNTYTARPVCWRKWISWQLLWLKTLMLGHGGSSAGSYLADPHPIALCCHYPVSKCCSASIVMTSTVRVN